MLRHRPFFVEGDNPLTCNKKLLKAVVNAFGLLEIYQPFGTISSLGIKESLKFLNHYKKDLINRIREKKLKECLESRTVIVSIGKINYPIWNEATIFPNASLK